MPPTVLCMRACHVELRLDINHAGKAIHAPVRDRECSLCHQAHESTGQPFLLAASSNELCTGCHDLGEDGGREFHDGISVGGSDCASCHEPHAAAGNGLILPVRHAPFAADDCETCHVVEDAP